MTKRNLLLLILALLLLLARAVLKAETTTAAPGIKFYDAYFRGIPFAELSVKKEADGPRTFTLKKRDIKSLQWSEPIIAREDKLEGHKDLRLYWALRHLPAQLKKIESIDWSKHELIAFPDKDHLYLKHRKLTESAAGKTVTAYYWGVKDAAYPAMDVIMGGSNELIAAVDVRTGYYLVRRGYENFTLHNEWTGKGVSPIRYGYRLHGTFKVKMSDGVNLTTIVCLPDDGKQGLGPFPVIFIRTPYTITDSMLNYNLHYCVRGYAFVIQACRGTSHTSPPNYRSGGKYEFSVNEIRDGADALDWISKQPWCDGNIGMQGSSYLGFTQMACTMARHPALKCIIPEVCMGTVFSDALYIGGGFTQGAVSYIFEMLDKKILPNRTWSEILRHRPLIEIDSFAAGEDLPQWNTQMDHWRSDDYWKQQDFFLTTKPRNVAALQIGGWFDDCFPGMRRSWELLQRQGGGQPQRMIIGPWRHNYNDNRKLNGFDFGISSLRTDIFLIKQMWFDRFLKGMDNGVDQPVVEYFVLGANEWRSAAAWPPKNAEPRKWYFHSSGRAHKLETDGRLSPLPPSGSETADEYIYDPEDPAPNWMSWDRLEYFEDVQQFPYDFKDIETRNDVVIYTSAPLKEDLTVAGDVMAVLYTSCDVKDTDWWVYLSDVHPDGSSVRLTTYMLRARFRNLEDKVHHVFGSNFEKEELLSGDMTDVVRYDISMLGTAAVFKKGHRLRIGVTNACEGYGFPNSNTGKNEAYVTKTVKGTMAIHHSKKYPSHVILPVLKKSEDNGDGALECWSVDR